MAFDGITTACLRKEIEDRTLGGRIFKIAQTESDEIILTIKPLMERGGGQVKLLLSADATLPLCYFTEENKTSPASAPSFCMLLRKHLTNGRITAVVQPGLERILRIEVEHLNEMGDLCHHTLIIELMGKYSNLIFVDDEEQIVDSIKHISSMVSSLREVLPGRPYFIAQTQNKKDALTETKEGFLSCFAGEVSAESAASVLVKSYTGFSNVTGEELCWRAGITAASDAEQDIGPLTEAQKESLWAAFDAFMQAVRNGDFHPVLYSIAGRENEADTPKEYAAFPLSMYADLKEQPFDSMSALLEYFYAARNRLTRIRQRTADLRHIVTTLLERDVHKYDLQRKQLQDTEKKDKYRVYGELLNAYGYGIEPGVRSCVLDNYYTNEKMTVPLDPQLSAAQNAKKYFERYNKLKRTQEALTALTAETAAEISQLKNILVSLDLSAEEGDLAQIREELIESGLLHRKGGQGGNGRQNGKQGGKGGKSSKSRVPAGKPLHYRSSDGYDIYVGKNNTQNDEITFHLAGGSDLWFHANDMPGSHVVLKTNGKKMEEIPDRTFEEAASLAAYYSSGREQGKVEIDYVPRREVKKPAGAKPGFVVYYTNYSMIAGTDISGIRQAEE
jgi:predicted ribosome quality control (RQC) complex YloA/Tae2 family protein